MIKGIISTGSYIIKLLINIFENIDYFLDSNQEGNPKIVTGNALKSA